MLPTKSIYLVQKGNSSTSGWEGVVVCALCSMKYTKVHKKWLILVSGSLDSLLKKRGRKFFGRKKGAKTVISSKKGCKDSFSILLAEEKRGKEFF